MVDKSHLIGSKPLLSQIFCLFGLAAVGLNLMCSLMLFIEMLEVDGFIPNPTTMASVLPSCVHSQAFLDREGMHGFVIKLGFGRDIYVQNALMDMYSRTGKVEISKNILEGLNLFHTIRDDYKINPTSDHYACLVDLLGRAGKLEAANELINNIPAQYDKTVAWSSLLGACRLYKNVELGEIAARILIQLEPHIDIG